jgi:hypothetical protein
MVHFNSLIGTYNVRWAMIFGEPGTRMISIQYFWYNGVKGVQQLGICLHVHIRCYAQVFLAGMHLHRKYIISYQSIPICNITIN